MAAAVATPTVTFKDATQGLLHIVGTVAISASPATYAATGLVMDFTGKVETNRPPIAVSVRSAVASGSGATSLFVYNFNPGTTPANGKLQVFTGAAAQSALAELADGAVPAGVSGDTIQFEAWFKKGGV
jgi:hypothetical protein